MASIRPFPPWLMVGGNPFSDDEISHDHAAVGSRKRPAMTMLQLVAAMTMPPLVTGTTMLQLVAGTTVLQLVGAMPMLPLVAAGPPGHC